MEDRTVARGILLALALAASMPLAAQEEPAELSKHPVLSAKPSDEDVATALERVKATILPKCWEPKCDDDGARRDKYLRKWQTVVSDHYIVFTNGPTATCKKYAVTLEKLYDSIKKELPFADPDHLLVAYIFADKDDYYRFAIRITGYSEEGAHATAGHAMSTYYATYYSSPRDPIVYHEASHEIVGACLKVGGVGSWFQEGMAVYFEKKMSNQRLDGCKSDFKHGACYPLSEFLAIPTLLSDPNGHGHRNYDHAGALLDFMINTKEEPVAGKFEQFLAAARKQGYGFARGEELSARLIKKVYGLSVEEFEAAWMRHLGAR